MENSQVSQIVNAINGIQKELSSIRGILNRLSTVRHGLGEDVQTPKLQEMLSLENEK